MTGPWPVSYIRNTANPFNLTHRGMSVMSNSTMKVPAGDYFVETEVGGSSPNSMALPEGTYSIGRLPVSDLTFHESHLSVSREHASITVHQEAISIVDDSSMGTWVNGLQLIKGDVFSLEIGDRINLGSQECVVRIGSVADPSKIGTIQMQNFLKPVPEITLNPDSRLVELRGSELNSLTPQEYEVLEHLWLQSGIVCEYDTLYQRMRPDDFSDPDADTQLDSNAAVRNLIMGIRRKLGRSSILIRNVPTIGYTVSPLRFIDQPPFI